MGVDGPSGSKAMNEDLIHDVIVVGAGAAGCTLASRLSEDLSRTVLLIEAGPDEPPGREHPEIRDAFPTSVYNPAFSWPSLLAETGIAPVNGGPRASRPFLQGYGVGGGSNINGMNVLRGHPDDYDRWAAGGATGWAWNDVLPYFRKLEHDLDHDGPLNGTDGPLPMRRIEPVDWAPFAQEIGKAMMKRSYPLLEDYNADFGDGVASLPISSPPDRRVSAATAYLSDAVRARPNLRIIPKAKAERILFDGRRATGLDIDMDGGRRRFHGREIVLTCGGIFSPALLLRSGIGPGDQLRRLGIDIVAALPGVGQNLQNHPTLNVTSYLPLRAMQPLSQRAVAQNCLRYSSNLPDCGPHDMGIVVFNRSAWHPLGRRIGTVGLSIYQPYSIGSVELASSDPREMPRIRFNTLDDPRDLDRMVSGLKLMLDLMIDPDVEAVRGEAFLPNPRIVASFGRKSAWNWLRTAFVASLLDVGPLRRRLLGDALLDLHAMARDPDALRDYVTARTSLAHHVCGTCRMGDVRSSDVVVNPRGQVKGVDGLRIADPSIFPVIPRGGMYVQAIMASEKIADDIKADGETVDR